jgi:predicted dehydrogenase
MPVRVCVVGTGHMGKIHARKLASMKDVTLTCLYDLNKPQVEDIANQLGVPSSDRYEEAFSDGVRGAVVASPTESHYSVARFLLEKGIHVFIEKPIAAEISDAERLVDLARKKGLILQIGHLERFNPSFRKALSFITDPFVIETRRVGGFTGRSIDIDVVNDLMIHDIDLVMSLKETVPIKSVKGRGVRVHTAKADVATARVEFEDGCVATLTASRTSQTKERTIEISQRDRHISIDLASGRTVCFGGGGNGKRSSYCYAAKRLDAVADELKAFVRAIKGDAEAIVAGEDGLRALRLAKEISGQIEAEWK